jgi:hypothetical protein
VEGSIRGAFCSGCTVAVTWDCYCNVVVVVIIIIIIIIIINNVVTVIAANPYYFFFFLLFFRFFLFLVLFFIFPLFSPFFSPYFFFLVAALRSQWGVSPFLAYRSATAHTMAPIFACRFLIYSCTDYIHLHL